MVVAPDTKKMLSIDESFNEICRPAAKIFRNKIFVNFDAPFDYFNSSRGSQSDSSGI